MCARKLFLVCSALVLLTLATASADTIPGGNVSGTWYQANSPYYITGNITIPASDTLTIEPGVLVNFLGYYGLTVDGFLEAVGTVSDSIHFFPEDTTTHWQGITYYNLLGLTHTLSYCTFRYAWGGAIGRNPYNGNLTISHCDFSNNGATIHFDGFNANLQILHSTFHNNLNEDGGAIYLKDFNGSAPIEITDCLFENNTAIDWGGAIYCFFPQQNLNITDCIFSGNTAGVCGGAICLDIFNGPLCEMTGCQFTDNSATNEGGAILTSAVNGVILTDCHFGDNEAGNSNGNGGGAIGAYDTDFNISRCTFYRNKALGGADGGAVSMDDLCTFTLDHCTFWGNDALWGGALWAFLDCDMNISNSIIAHDLASGGGAIAGHGTSSLAVSYTDFHDNNAGNIYWEVEPPNFGILDRVNYNGDSCDCYYDIFMDPMFVDTANNDFHLTASSPCIDAGDPLFAYDPDSTITDIGAYFFDQRAPDIELSDSLLDFGTVTVGQQADLPLIIYNIGNDTLELYGIACSLSVFWTDWNPSQNMVPPGDSLSILVSFAPDDTISYEDTLWIDNNDELTHVQLLGEGQPVTGMAEDSPHAVRESFELEYPNPSISPGRIRFALPKSCEVTLSLYDITGRIVATLAEGWHEAGAHDVTFSAKKFSQGVYFLRFEAEGTCIRRKLILFE